MKNIQRPLKMNILGIGHKLALITILYTIGIWYICDIFNLQLSIPVSFFVLKIISGILLLIGIPFFIISVKTLLKGFPTGKLMKTGVYSICRNPLYSSFICFIVPALMLLSNSLLLLTVPIFMYFVFKFLIKDEEVYLASVFGTEYLEYKKQINVIIPMIKIKKVGWV